MELDEGIQFVT